MKYRTTCPHCASVFRLGPDQLDAAQGWAQCSVCGVAFDARLSLLLEDGSPLPLVEPEPVEPPPAPEFIAPTEHVDSLEEEASALVGTKAQESAAPDLEEVAIPGMPQGIVQREESDDLPSIILIDPNIPVPDDPGPLPHIYAPTYAYDPAAPVYPQSASGISPHPPTARIEYATTPPAPGRIAPVPRRVKTWVWVMASILLLVTLVAQITFFLRDTVVSQLPQTRPAFVQVCGLLGCTLSLPRNLDLLQIVGSDLQTEAKGRLRLTLTLGNRASHVQAWPVLVLTLTDQRNQPLARRSFAPSEYLGDPQRIAAGMPARSEQALNLPLTVEKLAPMGFDLQLTY